MKTPTSMCAVSMQCVYFAWWNRENICACVCVCQESPCQKRSCLHCDAWFHPIWSIYPENEKPTFFTLIPLRCYLSLSFNFLLLFLLHNFFQSCRLNVLSRLTWQGRTWSPSSPPGMPLIPTFPSLSKVRLLDRSLAMELRYCSDENILLPCPPFFRC